MQRRLAFVLAWVAVTGVSVFIATQAVGTVRDQVTDTPATLPTFQAAATPTTTSASIPVPSSTVVDTTSGTTLPLTSVDPVPTTTVPTTTAPEPVSTSTTTTPPVTSAPTTTVAPPAMETVTYELTGGWVRIRYGGGEVYLVDAAPYAGYTMKAEKTGPAYVEIEFEGPGYDGYLEAEMDGGKLVVEIDESDGEDD